MVTKWSIYAGDYEVNVGTRARWHFGTRAFYPLCWPAVETSQRLGIAQIQFPRPQHVGVSLSAARCTHSDTNMAKRRRVATPPVHGQWHQQCIFRCHCQSATHRRWPKMERRASRTLETSLHGWHQSFSCTKSIGHKVSSNEPRKTRRCAKRIENLNPNAILRRPAWSKCPSNTDSFHEASSVQCDSAAICQRQRGPQTQHRVPIKCRPVHV